MDAPPAPVAQPLKYTLDFDKRFRLDRLEPEKLARLVEDKVFKLFPKDCNPRASIRLSGEPQRTADFKDIQAWSNALSLKQLAHADLSIWSDGGSFQLTVRPLEQELNVRLSVPEAEKNEAQLLFDDLVRELSLEPVSKNRKPSLVTVTGEYAIAKSAFQPLAPTLIERAAALCGSDLTFWGEIRLKERYEVARNFSRADEWNAQLRTQAWTLVHANCNAELNEVRTRYRERRSELSIDVAAETEDAACTFLRQLENDLSLVPAPAEEGSRRGVTTSYFLRKALDLAAARGIPAMISAATGSTHSQSGRVRLRSGATHTFTDASSWQKELESHWKSVTSLSFQVWAQQRNTSVDVDLQRDIVGLVLEQPSPRDLEEVTAKIGSSLDLIPRTGDEYRYRRFGRFYKMGKWNSAWTKNYVNALDETLKIAFPGRMPAIANAFVSVGSSQEDLLPVSSVEEFKKLLAEHDDFGRASIVFEGPRGLHIGVHVEREAGKFRILGNLARSDFTAIDKAFNDAIDMKLERSADAASTEKKDSKSFGVTFVLPTVAALLGSSLVGQLLQTWREPDKLEIVTPTKEQSVCEQPDTTFFVRWRLTAMPIAGRSKPDDQRPASVRLRATNGKIAVQPVEGRGEASLACPRPGSYTLEVTTDDVIVGVPVKVPAPPPPATSATSAASPPTSAAPLASSASKARRGH